MKDLAMDVAKIDNVSYSLQKLALCLMIMNFTIKTKVLRTDWFALHEILLSVDSNSVE